MSKRDLVKKLDSLAKRVKVRRAGILPIIDATKLFTADDWQAFREGDAETREKMRQEYAPREAVLVAEQTAHLPESADDPHRITAIVVRTYVPDAENEWRYFDADEEPD